LFKNWHICCREAGLLFWSFQICSLGLCTCATRHTCCVITTEVWPMLQVFAPLSIFVEYRLSWHMCKTYSTEWRVSHFAQHVSTELKTFSKYQQPSTQPYVTWFTVTYTLHCTRAPNQWQQTLCMF
jgi:hypothetical protein